MSSHLVYQVTKRYESRVSCLMDVLKNGKVNFQSRKMTLSLTFLFTEYKISYSPQTYITDKTEVTVTGLYQKNVTKCFSCGRY